MLSAAQHYEDCHRFSAGVAAGVTNPPSGQNQLVVVVDVDSSSSGCAARRASDRGRRRRRRRRRSEAAVAAGVPRIQLQQLSCCCCFCQQLTPFVQVSARPQQHSRGRVRGEVDVVDCVDVSRFVLVCNFDVCTTYMCTNKHTNI